MTATDPQDLALLDVLRHHGPLTALQLAEHLGTDPIVDLVRLQDQGLVLYDSEARVFQSTDWTITLLDLLKLKPDLLDKDPLAARLLHLLMHGTCPRSLLTRTIRMRDRIRPLIDAGTIRERRSGPGWRWAVENPADLVRFLTALAQGGHP